MPVVPTGSPTWLRQNSHVDLGGHTEKKNYQSQDAINGRTDLSAQNVCRIAADLAAVGRTAPFCTLTYTQDDTGTANPTIDSYETMAGADPTGVRDGDGDVTWTWANSYLDAYSQSGDVHILQAVAMVHGTTAAAATCEILDTNADDLNEIVRVRCFDDTGASVTDRTVTLIVWTGPTT